MFVSAYHPRSLAPSRVSHVHLNTPPSRPNTRRRIIWVILALSFVPYGLPTEYQPSIYKDGKTPEEIRRGQRERRLNRVLGGNLRKTEFGDDVLHDLP